MRIAECITGTNPRNRKIPFCCVDFVEMWFRLWRKEENVEPPSAGELRVAKICNFLKSLTTELGSLPREPFAKKPELPVAALDVADG
jgi:hypothetical protein